MYSVYGKEKGNVMREFSKFIHFLAFKELHDYILENNIPPLTQKVDELCNRNVVATAGS